VLCYCCTVVFLEVSECYHLPHWAVTSHCSLLKAVCPKRPNIISPFFSRAVLATSVIGVSRGDHSPTATSAPSLDQLIPSCSLIGYSKSALSQSSKVFFFPLNHTSKTFIQIFSFFSSFFFNTISLRFLLSLSHTTVGAVTHGEAVAPIYPALTLLTISFSVLEVVDLSTVS
jgi:hypothetical protein